MLRYTLRYLEHVLKPCNRKVDMIFRTTPSASVIYLVALSIAVQRMTFLSSFGVSVTCHFNQENGYYTSIPSLLIPLVTFTALPANTLCKAYFRGEFISRKQYAACSNIKADRKSQSSDVILIKIAAASA